jgi:TctA family transporter
LNDGSYAFLWERALTLGIVAVTVIVACVPLVQAIRSARAAARTSGR